ncbi:hypothetical protein [Gloeocapsopsis dulcis]|uniref:CRISPR type III-B/RAMP module-associated protein Cmr5 n=1 Tax=Gloeocapsopsis dulcis AAB1 = 1H9 TaxID=1433147 RepID=A0A6N8FZ10_9CHRO|nr:hypothetical protein [Gloeocapsopsis dulcis]MUL38191.1 hypothetical protein [Gloeocapsopsis dulcis AAB1 = 1H9]WNN90777.1 hypothetical protein P0S91_06790 [Gloeocapsopsis dulcis]
MTFDPRTIGKPVYEALSNLRSLSHQDETRLKEQKNQAVELYTYLSTWGMLRLKAEEKALSQEGKKQIVRKYFECLQQLSGINNLANDGLNVLKNLSTDEYLGLTGLGLALAQEFSFWATAVYYDVTGGE